MMSHIEDKMLVYKLKNGIRWGNLEEINSFYSQGLGAYFTVNQGLTPLQLAVLHDKKAIVEYFIQAGEDIYGTGRRQKGLPPICLARTQAIKKVLNDANKIRMNQFDSNGATPLTRAVIEDRPELVEYLLKQGANVYLNCQDGTTPLGAAIRSNNTVITQLLIKEVPVHHALLFVDKGNNVCVDILKLIIDACVDWNTNEAIDDEDKIPITTIELIIAEVLQKEYRGINKDDIIHYLNILNSHGPTQTDLFHNLLGKLQSIALNMKEVNLVLESGDSLLAVAVQHNHSGMIEYLIRLGANPCKVSKGGQLPLVKAAINGNLPITSYLLENGAEETINTTSVYAVQSNQLEVLKLLINRGANVNFVNKIGNTPLMEAIIKKNLEMVKLLTGYGANIRSVNKEGCSVMDISVANEFDEGTKILIERGVDVNTLLHDGRTLLTHFISKKHSEMVTFLMGLEADVNLGDRNNNSPLTIALKCKNAPITKLLFESGACVKSVNLKNIWNEIYNNEDLIKELVLQGIDVNQILEVDEYDIGNVGSTLLTHFIINHNTEMAAFLIERGADVNLADINNNSPLTLALKHQDKATTELLFAHGACVKSIKLSTVWDKIQDDKGLVKELILRGLDVNQDLNGNTLLHQFADAYDLEMTTFLIENGANLNKLDRNNVSVLVKALQMGNVKLVNFLLEKGADPFSENYNILALAANEQMVSVVKTLIQNGANIESARHEIEALANVNEDFEFFLKNLRKRQSAGDLRGDLHAETQSDQELNFPLSVKRETGNEADCNSSPEDK